MKKFFKLKSAKLKKFEDKAYLHRIVRKKMTVIYCKFQKGWQHIKIKHISEEFLYVIKGHLKAKIGKNDYVLKNGDSVLIPSNEIHTIFALKDTLALGVFSPPITAKKAKAIIKK